jgi:hypothetical protein
MDLFRSPQQGLDPLDREILERAFDAILAAVKEHQPTEFDSDEGLEAILRRELIEMACRSGVSDPETLRDSVLTRLMTQSRRCPSSLRINPTRLPISIRQIACTKQLFVGG